MVLVIFLFSANRAWVYHRPNNSGGYFVAAYPKKIPFMWQYDADAMEFFQAAAFFPTFYKSHPALIGRPALPFLSYVIGNGIVLGIKPFLGTRLEQFLFEGSGISEQAAQTMVNRGETEKNTIGFLFPYFSALVGFIAVKILFFTLSGWAMFRFLSRYTDSTTALFAVALLFFSPYAVRSIATYHTYEFQILTPIIVIFLFHRLCEKYSLWRNVLYSLIVGVLMMAKANYAAYLGVLMYAVFFLKPRSIAYLGILISGLVHLLPWAIWTTFIEIQGMPVIGFLSLPDPQALAIHPLDIIGRKLAGPALVSDVGVSGTHSQPGVDFVDNILHSGIGGIFLAVKYNLINSMVIFSTFSSLLAAIGLFLFRHQIKSKYVLFIALFFLATWMQGFFSFPYGPKSRALYDVNFIVFGFTSVCVCVLARKFLGSRKNAFLIFFLGAYIFYSFFSFVRLPWVHPHDQIAYSGESPLFILRHTKMDISTREYHGTGTTSQANPTFISISINSLVVRKFAFSSVG